MDEKIGIVIDELEKKGIIDNTIIVFQSDQGHSTEERAFGGGGNAGVYRGCKSSLFEGGIRVPAIIRYPEAIPANQVRDQMVSEMDWLPTIAELTHSKIIDKGIEGKSMMPVIKNENEKTQHNIIHWQLGNYDDKKSQWVVRDGDWKLLGNPKDPTTNQKFKKGTLFLVNLKEDVSEKKNLSNQYPERVKKMQALHDKWLIEVKNAVNIE